MYNTRNAADILRMKSKRSFFKNSNIPSTIIEPDKEDHNIRNAESYALRKRLLSFIRPEANNILNVHDVKRTRHVTPCNNRDDLLHLRFTLKILIFWETYI